MTKTSLTVSVCFREFLYFLSNTIPLAMQYLGWCLFYFYFLHPFGVKLLASAHSDAPLVIIPDLGHLGPPLRARTSSCIPKDWEWSLSLLIEPSPTVFGQRWPTDRHVIHGGSNRMADIFFNISRDSDIQHSDRYLIIGPQETWWMIYIIYIYILWIWYIYIYNI